MSQSTLAELKEAQQNIGVATSMDKLDVNKRSDDELLMSSKVKDVSSKKDVNVTNPRDWAVESEADPKLSHYDGSVDSHKSAVDRPLTQSPHSSSDSAPRKRSISERLHDNWNDLKHKANELLHPTPKSEHPDSKKS